MQVNTQNIPSFVLWIAASLIGAGILNEAAGLSLTFAVLFGRREKGRAKQTDRQGGREGWRKGERQAHTHTHTHTGCCCFKHLAIDLVAVPPFLLREAACTML